MKKNSFLYEKKDKKKSEFVQEFLYIEDYEQYIPEIKEEVENQSVITIDLFGSNEEENI